MDIFHMNDGVTLHHWKKTSLEDEGAPGKPSSKELLKSDNLPEEPMLLSENFSSCLSFKKGTK